MVSLFILGCSNTRTIAAELPIMLHFTGCEPYSSVRRLLLIGCSSCTWEGCGSSAWLLFRPALYTGTGVAGAWLLQYVILGY